ncbi:unnamed protein product [Lymnaea stagnalis]|uniref:Mitochondrial cardiolipin hydrolase n=1 Tax=Lymnaea stagnalis TaxID=6523 RepID=A0AAV2I6A8_LYMST
MNSNLRGALYTVLFFIASEVLYKLYCKTKKHKSKTEIGSESRLSSTSLQVLFFPDEKVACKDYFITDNGCVKQNCRFSHEKSSLSELYKHLCSGKTTVDICVYIITCKDLAEILMKMFKRGVKIRIITDKDQLQASGSQIWSLRKEGIPVRTNDSSYLMHHKFVIIDNRVLINGSFNWTYQAITGNQENVLITDDDAVTSVFKAEFQRLWEDFGSQNSTGDLRLQE